MTEYLDINRANWDARATVHMGPGGYALDEIADPTWLSGVVKWAARVVELMGGPSARSSV